MKELYLIRHGSLNAVCTGKLVGQNDQPLSEKGIEEAKACGRFLHNAGIEAAYSGNLKRVLETVEAVRSAASDIPIPRIDTRLNECDFGLWCMKDASTMDDSEKEIFAQWNMGNWNFSFPGGETMQAFADRTRAALNDIIKAEKDSERVAIFSHGGVIMSLLADITGLDRRYAFRLWLSRGAVAKVVFSDDKSHDGVVVQGGRLCMMIKPADIIF